MGHLPDGVTVSHLPTQVEVIDAGADDVALVLSDGSRHRVDAVCVTVGVPGARLDTSAAAAGQTVLLAGMGLTAIDAVVDMTVGRGGRFVEGAGPGDLVYRASGDEPVIEQYSRHGFLPLCRPTAPLDGLAGWAPVLPLMAVEEGARSVELGAGVLPALLFAVARAEDADADAARSEAVATLLADLDPPVRTYGSATSYAGAVQAALDADLREATAATLPPRRRGLESLKLLRDDLRRLCDFDRLTPASHETFLASVLPLFYRYTVGPPVSRGRELMALVRAGVLRHTLGPAPRVTRLASGVRAESTALVRPTVVETDIHLEAFLPAPSVDVLPGFLARAVGAGQAEVRQVAGRAVGIAVDSRFRPVGPQGVLTDRVTYLGGLTEGSRHFNFYVPSPGVRVRARHDAERCVDQLVTGMVRAAVRA